MKSLWIFCFIYFSVLLMAAEKPNIILIVSDDHRYDFMGFMDEAPEFLETPHMDRHMDVYAHRDGEARFLLALGWLLDGVEAARIERP